MIKCKKCKREISEEEKICPNCGAKVKKESIFKFFVKLLCLLALISVIGQTLSLKIGESLFSAKGGQDAVTTCFNILITFVIILLTGKKYIFTEKKEKFLKSVALGWAELIVSVPIFIASIISVINSIKVGSTLSAATIINLLILYFAVGCSEEFLFRGWLQNSLLEKFNKNKKQVLLSIIVTSIIFGLVHMANVGDGQSLHDTILQVISAASGGFFYGAVYYKTKNIWSVVFLHGFWDFSIELSEATMLRGCESGTLTSQFAIYDSSMVVLIVILQILGGILILRKKSKEEPTIENAKIKKQNIVLVCVIILAAIILAVDEFELIPVKGREESEICFEYKTKVIEKGYEKGYVYLVDKSYKLTSSPIVEYDESGEEISQTQNTIMVYKAKHKKYNIFGVMLEDSNGDRIMLPYELKDFTIFENETYYGILILEEDFEPNTIYYAKVYKQEIIDNKGFLEKVKASFVKYDLPIIDNIGYIKLLDTDEKLPYMESNIKDKFMIDTDDNLYLLK